MSTEAREIVRKSLGENSGGGFVLVEVPARTERCEAGELTYIPSEVVEIRGERLCVYCRMDKYGLEELRDEDIPF